MHSQTAVYPTLESHSGERQRLKMKLIYVLIFSAMFGILTLAPFLISLLLGLLCAWALLGVKQSIQALSLCVMVKFLNPALYTFPEETGALAWLVIFVAVVRLLPSVRTHHSWFLIPLLSFSAVVASLSIFVSPNPQISLLKLASFSVVVGAVLVGMTSASRNDIAAWQTWFLSLTISIILVSIPTFFIPSVGYHTNGRGFQGILNQPQALGTWLATACAWLVMGLFQIKRKGKVKLFGALSILAFLLISTKARTGAAAILLSVCATFMSTFIIRKRDSSLSRGRIVLIAIVVGLFLAFTLFFSPELSRGIKEFALKGQETDIEKSFYSSRGGGIETQWANFLNKPLAGNGFGVYPSGHFPSGVVTIFGIPISAATEKGFLPTAILEEVGVIGTGFFVWFLFSLIRRVTKNTDSRWINLFFACLFVNVGEAVLFSVGGIGLYFWLLIGLALATSRYSDERNKKANASVWRITTTQQCD